jgi:rhodanese-related sulfurtransferase
VRNRIKDTISKALILVLLGVGLGLAANQVSPRGLPLIAPLKPAVETEAYLPLDQARQLWHGGVAIFLDAREPADFAVGHIGNALNLPAQSFAEHFGEVAPLLTPETELVLYCDGPECELSHRLATSLRQQGYTNLHLLFNGWTAWRQADLPTTPGVQK